MRILWPYRAKATQSRRALYDSAAALQPPEIQQWERWRDALPKKKPNPPTRAIQLENDRAGDFIGKNQSIAGNNSSLLGNLESMLS